MRYRLFRKDSNEPLGTVDDRQLGTLVALLEEEDSGDTDYYVDQDVLDFLARQGADPALLELIRPHVPAEGGVDIEWRAV